MKIIRLRMAGFGPYKDEQMVDFEKFDDDGIFLITGKTGAGKSSILDAICYALYDTVPRYDKRESQLRSDYCDPGDPTFVELDFMLGDDAYRVHRTPKFDRPKQRGDGFTTAQPTALLSIRDGDGWRAIAARPVDVGHEIARILPIRAEQFLQVMLLAQNRFQQFLLAKTEDRRVVLRTLFGTVRFEALEKALSLRNAVLTQRVAGVSSEIDRITSTFDDVVADDAGILDSEAETKIRGSLEWFETLLAEQTRRREAAEATAAAATAALVEATTAERSAAEVRARQDRRVSASARLTALDERAVEIADWQTQLDDSARSLRVWPFIEAQQLAVREVTDAERAETLAVTAWLASGELAVPSTDELSDFVDDLLSERGALTDIRADEARLPLLKREQLALESALTDAAALVEQGTLRLAAIPAELDAIGLKITAAATAAAALEPARASESRIAAAVDAAKAAEALESKLDTALAAQKRASSANATAASAYDALLDARLAGHAAELAGALVAGEPCAVCGSTSHPHPAIGDAGAITESDIEDAANTRSARHSELATADSEVQRVTGELERARGAAGGKPLPALLAESEMATAEVRLALEATRQLAEAESRRARLAEERKSAEALAAKLSEKRDVARAALTEHRTLVSAIDSRVMANLGGYDSVADRMAAVDTRLGAARTLTASLDRTANAHATLDSATTAVSTQLAQLDFDTVAAATAARREKATIAAFELGIRQHTDGVAAARATLAEPELQNLPEQVLDLEPTKVTLAAANDARDSALADAHRLEAISRQAGALATEASGLVTTTIDLVSEQTQVRELAELVEGRGSNTRRIRLETYVLAARLEEIIAAANQRLETMTSDRYTLELDDAKQYRGVETGLGLSIRDAHTGRTRATHSLSGGETFLASLALALGLAEVVSNQAGGIALDTLFVDEGFGSLDGETLDVAMSTLDGLRAGGRTIGLISHVDSMKEQIPAKLRIVVAPAGGSRIDYGAEAD